MARCAGCDYPLPTNRDLIGARCPNCFDPLYEPLGRFGRPVRLGETPCAVHATNESLGPCMRCGLGVCEICRCTWQREIICVKCAEKAAEKAGPVSTVTDQAAQARASLACGVLAWLAGGAGVWLATVVGALTGPLGLLLVFVTFGLLALAGALALVALGQALAALTIPGAHGMTAGLGMTLGGALVGVLLAALGLGAWLPG